MFDLLSDGNVLWAVRFVVWSVLIYLIIRHRRTPKKESPQRYDYLPIEVAKKPKRKKTRKKSSGAKKVMNYFKRHPNRNISLDELRASVKGVKKKYFPILTSNLCSQGELKRVHRGIYVYTPKE